MKQPIEPNNLRRYGVFLYSRTSTKSRSPWILSAKKSEIISEVGIAYLDLGSLASLAGIPAPKKTTTILEAPEPEEVQKSLIPGLNRTKDDVGSDDPIVLVQQAIRRAMDGEVMQPKQREAFAPYAAMLEKILEELESGEVGIDQLAKLVKRANELIKFCKDKLKATDEEVKTILESFED